MITHITRIMPCGYRRVESNEIVMQGDLAAIQIKKNGDIIWEPSYDIGKRAGLCDSMHICEESRMAVLGVDTTV